jgi:hypothetical protein
MLLILAIGVFVGSNIITNWINETDNITDKTARKLVLDHREKSRELLNYVSSSLLYEVENFNVDVTSDEKILQLINKHISPIKGNRFGEVMLVRISPDGKILYDSYWGTIRDIDITKNRTLSNEIIPQNIIIEQIDNFIKGNNYTKDGIITIEEINDLKIEYPQVYSIIDRYINYKNIENVSQIYKEIRSGNSTDSQDNYIWQLKSGETQLLEWVTIPPGSLGFYNIPDSVWGMENPNHRWVLILRSNKKNVLRNYLDVFRDINAKVAVTKVLYMFLIFILISSIIIISYYIAILEKK